jgi:catechol 2,3-dioxygenase-like lactoylglutathione lyase family enzyme
MRAISMMTCVLISLGLYVPSSASQHGLASAVSAPSGGQEAKEKQDGDGEAGATLPTDFRRTTLIVSDIDRSLSIYRDILGMKVSYDIETTMTGRAVPAGNAGDKARFVLLATNDPWVGLLGLLQWTDPPLPPRGPSKERVGPGDSVLIFRSSNVEDRCESVARVPGVTMFSEPHLHTYQSRNGSGDIPLLFCVFFDPDGHLVELSELVPAAA